MDMIYTKEMTVASSVCAADGKMSVTGALSVFMDAATLHAEQLGLGLKSMREKGLFWVASKNMMKVTRLPGMCEDVTLRTWPVIPGSIRSERQYQLLGAEGTVITGKTVWAVIDISTGRPVRLRGVMDPSLPYCTDAPCADPFPRLVYEPESFTDLGKHRILSSDIDIGGHMNNVMYLRALFSCFSVAELEERPVKSLSVEYLSACYEGEELSFRIRDNGPDADAAALRDDGRPAVLFRLEY